MSYPIHKTPGSSAARTVRTESELWGLDLAAGEPGRSLALAYDTENLLWEGDALTVRPGYRPAASLAGAIHGIYHYGGELVVHAGTSLYRVTEGEAPVLVPDTGLSLADAPSVGVVRRQQVVRRRCVEPSIRHWSREQKEQDFLFLNDGANYFFYDGEALRPVADSYWKGNLYTLYDRGVRPDFYATIPFGEVGKKALNGVGDVDPRGDNRLSQFRTESFYLDEGEKISELHLNCLMRYFNTKIPVELQIRDTEGVWRCLVSETITHMDARVSSLVRLEIPSLHGMMSFNYDEDDETIVSSLETGVCNLAFDGSDNIRVTYPILQDPPEALNGATVQGLYGADGDDDVLFLGGSAAAPGEDAFSAPGDFFCFYQTATERLGSYGAPVTGYCRLKDGRLAVLKDDPGGSTVFFRSHDIVEVGATLAGEPYRVEVYPSRTGASVDGCVSPRTVGVAGNEPVFLARTGLYSVRSVSNELIDLSETVRRSIPIDPLLTTLDVGEARSVCWQNYYLLAFGNTAFVTDGRRDGDGQLRFLKWRLAHPVSAFGAAAGRLYFGTADGGLYRFGEGTDDAGAPITAYWRAPAAETGDGRNLLLRRLWAAVSPGYGATLSARLYRDRVPLPPTEVPLHRTDLGDWDFGNVSFDGTAEARWVPLTYCTVNGNSIAVEADLSAGPDLKLWGFRLTYEKGGKMQ